MSTFQAASSDDGFAARLMSASVLARLAPSFELSCPRCHESLVYDDIHFVGMPILIACHCSQCHVAYLLDWPAGHALLHPTIVEVESGAAHFDGREWYPRLLERLIASRKHPTAAHIDVRGLGSGGSTVIVVNCIDFLYGHCVLKTLSGLRYSRDADPDADVVMIVQQNVSWLVPSTVDIVIEVDVPLSDGGQLDRRAGQRRHVGTREL